MTQLMRLKIPLRYIDDKTELRLINFLGDDRIDTGMSAKNSFPANVLTEHPAILEPQNPYFM